LKSLAAFFLLAFAVISADSMALSVCSNNVCGRIVCQSGCIQRAVNGVCVVNTCTGFRALVGGTEGEADDTASFGQCVSCAGSCCAGGNSFLSAERACKAACGDFGCFTRCN